MALYFDQSGNRLGSNNSSADKRELFLKVFSGEIISQYETKCVMKDLVRTRSISQGKSASFPLYGSATAKWHTPGENILEKERVYAALLGQLHGLEDLALGCFETPQHLWHKN